MFGFLKCKIPSEYTIIPMHNGKWCLRYNLTNIPYVCRYNGKVVEYKTIAEAKKGIKNLSREKIDI